MRQRPCPNWHTYCDMPYCYRPVPDPLFYFLADHNLVTFVLYSVNRLEIRANLQKKKIFSISTNLDLLHSFITILFTHFSPMMNIDVNFMI